MCGVAGDEDPSVPEFGGHHGPWGPAGAAEDLVFEWFADTEKHRRFGVIRGGILAGWNTVVEQPEVVRAVRNKG